MLRWRLICLQVVPRRVMARLCGASLGRGVMIVGRLRIKKASGAELVIGDGACVYSSPVANEVIGRRHTTLWAMVSGAVLELEKNVGCSSACICAAKEIRIGEGTIIGADAMILDNDFHVPAPDFRWVNGAADTARPIRIGRGCFIGTRAIVLKGVTVGDGSVVGAGAVVTRDVPAGHLAFGNPAKVRPLSEKWRRSS